MENFFYFVENLMKTNSLLSLPLVFISGVLVSFTPCFYPLIPVILGILGIEEKASFKKVLSLSLVYVLGLSLIYTGLGIVCSLSGKIFGQFSKSFWVQFTGAIVFAFMGLALLDLFSFSQFRLPLKFNHKRLGIFGVFFLGVIGGLVSGSCTFPVLGAILFLTALNKDVFLGGVLLFVFSLGIGVIFIMTAIFGRSMLDFFKKNPKISLGIKKVFGILLLGISFYFLVRGIYLL